MQVLLASSLIAFQKKAALLRQLALGVTLLGACEISYHVDRVPDSGAGGHPGPSTPAVAINGIPIPCERWGGGPILADPERALNMAVEKLWQGDVSDMEEARFLYEGILTGGRAGDLYCVVAHMLEDNRAARGVAGFYDSWLNLGQYPEKDPTLFAEYVPARLELMGRDARDFAVDVTLRGDSQFGELFTSEAAITVAPNWDQVPVGARPDVSEVSAGLLSQPGVLATLGRAETFPMQRGAWVFDKFFCSPVPPPQEGIDPVSLLPSAGQSFRRRHEEIYTRGTSCSYCHQAVAPIGYALDAFDAVGRLHPLDRAGQPFDLSGVLKTFDGFEAPFASLAELGGHMGTSAEVRRCYVQRWAEYATEQPFAALPEQLDAAIGFPFPLQGLRTKLLIAGAFQLVFSPEPNLP